MALDIVIAGARGAGLKVLQIIEDRNAAGDDSLRLLGFFDDNPDLWDTGYFDYPVFGDVAKVSAAAGGGRIGVVSPIGDPLNRKKMIARLKLPGVVYPNLAHPSAQISKRATLGQGNIFSQNAVVQAGARIGDFNSFNIGAIMGPLAGVSHYCTVNALAMVASEARVDDYAYIGMGAKILQRLHIGAGTVVGANAFVNRDTAPWTTVVGVPARVIKTRSAPPEAAES
jgi:sugar O-acyltransferase (sialic acid O-acetyltransferase NeuD family)